MMNWNTLWTEEFVAHFKKQSSNIPLGTSATNWPIVPAPDDRWWWWWVWTSGWNENWQGKPKYSEKTCPTATLPTTKPHDLTWARTWGRRGGNPAINRLTYVTALTWMFTRDTEKSQERTEPLRIADIQAGLRSDHLLNIN
jgi:hypothetical protein